MDADRLAQASEQSDAGGGAFAKLIHFIRAWEGCVLKPYLDIGGKCTIGIGHLLGDNDPREAITEAQAIGLLQSDLARISHEVSYMVTVPLASYQSDALCSFAFNLGAGSLRDSTLLRLVNLGQFVAAGFEFPKWGNVRIGGVLQADEGLMRRRAAERAMFERDDYSGRP